MDTDVFTEGRKARKGSGMIGTRSLCGLCDLGVEKTCRENKKLSDSSAEKNCIQLERIQ